MEGAQIARDVFNVLFAPSEKKVVCNPEPLEFLFECAITPAYLGAYLSSREMLDLDYFEGVAVTM